MSGCVHVRFGIAVTGDIEALDLDHPARVWRRPAGPSRWMNDMADEGLVEGLKHDLHSVLVGLLNRLLPRLAHLATGRLYLTQFRTSGVIGSRGARQNTSTTGVRTQRGGDRSSHHIGAVRPRLPGAHGSLDGVAGSKTDPFSVWEFGVWVLEAIGSWGGGA